MDLGQDGGAGGQAAHAELGGSGDIEGDDLVGEAGGHVTADAPVSPPGALTLGVQVELERLRGGKVPVGLGGLPAQVDVEVPLGAGGADLDVVLEEESLGFLLVLGKGALPGDLRLDPVTVVAGDLGGEGGVGQGVVSTGQLQLCDRCVFCNSPTNRDTLSATHAWDTGLKRYTCPPLLALEPNYAFG